jgi:hypothetical protein
MTNSNALPFFQYMEIEKKKYVPLPASWRNDYVSINMDSSENLRVSYPPASGYQIPKDVIILQLTVAKQMFPNSKIVVDGKGERRKFKTVDGALHFLRSL